MKAPKIHRIGKKIPKKNIQPCRFRSVMSPSVNTRTKYKSAAPIPMPHHIGTSRLVRRGFAANRKPWLGNERTHHPLRMRPAPATADIPTLTGGDSERSQATDRGSSDVRLVAEENVVVEQVRYTGTHTGTWRSPDGAEIPATGRRLDFPFVGVFTIEGGKISSIRLYYDQLELFAQLGLMPGADAR